MSTVKTVLAVLVEHRLVTDRRTDTGRWLVIKAYCPCMASRGKNCFGERKKNRIGLYDTLLRSIELKQVLFSMQVDSLNRSFLI